jgi:hypothetical protein
MEAKSAAIFKRYLDDAEVKAEDAARVAQVPQDVADRLLTAARGAADEKIADWNKSTEQMVRGNIGDVTPENIKQRLASIEDYQFGNTGSQGNGGGEDIWADAVKTLLNASQGAAWKKETDARRDYMRKAITGSVVCTFDQRFGLNAGQWAKLEPQVAKVITECSDQFATIYNSYPPVPWYLQSFTMWIPVAGIPDKDMKGILSESQMKQWQGCNEHGEAEQLWQNIDQNRRNRGGAN